MAPSICTTSQSKTNSEIADGVVSEECHRGGVIVGAGFGSGVDDREDCVAPSRQWKGSILNEQLFSAEESDARPIDELGQILLSVDQWVVVLAQIGVKLGTAREPILMALVSGALRKHWVIERGRM